MNFKKLTETDRIVYKKFFEDFYSIPCFLKKKLKERFLTKNCRKNQKNLIFM